MLLFFVLEKLFFRHSIARLLNTLYSVGYFIIFSICNVSMSLNNNDVVSVPLCSSETTHRWLFIGELRITHFVRIVARWRRQPWSAGSIDRCLRFVIAMVRLINTIGLIERIKFLVIGFQIRMTEMHDVNIFKYASFLS